MPVLVGYSTSPEGEAALRRAVGECGLRAGRLLVIFSERAPDAAPSDEEFVREIAARVRDASAEQGVGVPEHEVRRFRGSLEPADDVLSVAEEVSASLIVIGLRRRSPVGKLILGGSAQRILLEASCPVLAVKGQASASAVSGVAGQADLRS